MTQAEEFDCKQHVREILETLPETPGVYHFLDSEGKILYIGKAKNLKNRVCSYFREGYKSSKTRALVRRIEDIKLIHVASEYEALLLENSLIKLHKPYYNILLKDDKTYPWIAISDEPYPRIIHTRRKEKKGFQYFGPYPSGKVLRELLKLIRELFAYRTCKLNLTDKAISEGKFKACMNAQIKLCLAPCEGDQTRNEYLQTIEKIKSVLRGNFSGILLDLKEQMMNHARLLEFEQAHFLKEKIQRLENYRSKWTVVGTNIKNVEVYAFESNAKHFYLNMLRVIDGSVVNAYTIEVVRRLDETESEILSAAILRLRDRFESEVPEIIVPIVVDLPQDYVRQTIPKTGDKKKLLELSQHNVHIYRMEKQQKAALVDPERHSKRILETMQKDLHMSELPTRIECFDNSNTQGTNPVASMVCFIQAKPCNKEYRHFIIKTVDQPDDYASMEEVVYRRYKSVLEKREQLPQLIVVDGGKGQVSAAVKSLQRLNLYGKITLIGIAKRLEELFFPFDPYPLYLDKNSETLKVLQRIRDEAHRFAITHHRKRRTKATIKTELTEINGIGETTARNLLLRFSSIKKIKLAPFAELEDCVGKSKAQLIWNYFHQEE